MIFSKEKTSNGLTLIVISANMFDMNKGKEAASRC
jgi:hypothetical protein